jgi:hypothetical protein
MMKASCYAWGDRKIGSSALVAEIFENAYYIPFSSNVFFDRDCEWGLYDNSGSLIEAAAYRRGADRKLVGQSATMHMSKDSFQDCDEDCFIYAGPVIPHFGHFILSSLARLWFQKVDLPLLFHSSPAIDGHKLAYITLALQALHEKGIRYASLSVPTRLKKVIVPPASFVEQSTVYIEYIAACEQIGRGFDRRRGVKSRPVYLSKSRLNQGIARLENEIDIELHISRMGVDIVYPELLSLEEQIDLFRTRQVILGMSGSAFHMQALTPRVENRRLILNLTPAVNSNFLLLDEIWGCKAEYETLSPWIADTPPGANFDLSYKLTSQEAVLDIVQDFLVRNRTSSSQGTNVATLNMEKPMARSVNAVDDLRGENYMSLLARLIDCLSPRNYFEIGTLHGNTLISVDCKTICVDPCFQISQNVIGRKTMCSFFQMKSDQFFAVTDPKSLFGEAIQFAFLDGMHRSEFLLRDFLNTERCSQSNSVIALHDCVPLDAAMAVRSQNAVPAENPGRAGWWTGDVWRTVLALKHFRPDLEIMVLDAQPTGLVLITNLDPSARTKEEKYSDMTRFMRELDEETYDVFLIHQKLDVVSTDRLSDDEKIHRHFWL